jgi:hypothetical protein
LYFVRKPTFVASAEISAKRIPSCAVNAKGCWRLVDPPAPIDAGVRGL